MIPSTLALPQRPLAIPNKPLAPPPLFWFSTVVLLALSVFMVFWQGPGLIRDIEINQNPVTVQDFDLDGKCRSRTGLTDCDGTVTYNYEGKSYTSDINLAFFDLTSSDYYVDVVVSRDKPELATLSLGIEMLWNRIIVFVLLVFFLAGGTLVMIWQALGASRANGRIAQPGRVTLVPVQVTQMNERGGRSTAGYLELFGAGKRSRRLVHTRFGKGEAPMMLQAADGTVYGLAAKHEASTLPVLLDERLDRLPLEASERQALIEAIDADQGRQGQGMMAPAPHARQGRNPAVTGLLAGLGMLVLIILGTLGYWVYYVTSGPTQFDSIGMEINNLMPGPINAWGCSQLEARFGNDRAPFGCTASDFTSWK